MRVRQHANAAIGGRFGLTIDQVHGTAEDGQISGAAITAATKSGTSVTQTISAITALTHTVRVASSPPSQQIINT